MIIGAGGNITVQTGEQGILLVDTGIASMSDKVWAAVQRIAPPRKPLRYVINTTEHPEHTGGNAVIAAKGETVPLRDANYTAGPQGTINYNRASVVSHQNVLNRMSAPTGEKSPTPPEAWPDNTYAIDQKRFYFNDEPVVMMNFPGNTDGNTIVFFRKSDVDQHGRPHRSDALSAHRPQSRRQYPGLRDQPEPIDRPVRPGVAWCWWHADRSWSRAHCRSRRGRLLPRHAVHRSRSYPGHDRQGHDAGTDESRATDARLRRALWKHDRVPGRPTCSSKRVVCEFERTRNEVRSRFAQDRPSRLYSVPRSVAPDALRTGTGARSGRRCRSAAHCARVGAQGFHRLLGVDRHRALASADAGPAQG